MDPLEYFPHRETPFDHQKDYLREHADDEFWGLFWEMGSGKSKAIIDNAAYLYDLGDINTLVVVALKGVYLNWPNREIPKHLPEHIPHRMLAWQNARGKKWEAEFDALEQTNDHLRIFVVNIEAFSSRKPKGAKRTPPPKVFAYLTRLLKTGKVMAVCDESSTIKDPNSSRTKNMITFGKSSDYRRALTGTPITQAPFDAYAQAEFLKPGILGFRSYYLFQRRYAEYRTVRFGDRMFDEVVKYQNLDELQDKLHEIGNFILKEDCLDLPEKLYSTRYVAPHKEQMKAYETMRQFMMLELQEDVVSAENALTKLTKLHQILCGFVLNEDGETHAIPHNRLAALDEALHETQGKVVIWTHFRASLRDVADHLMRTYGKETVVEYHGSVPQSARESAIDEFQDPKSPVRFFVANQQTAGYGLTLTEASTEIYYSNNYSLEQRLQSEDRCHRPGQRNNVSIIDLVVPDTIDEKVLEALTNKVDVASQVTGLFKSWIH